MSRRLGNFLNHRPGKRLFSHKGSLACIKYLTFLLFWPSIASWIICPHLEMMDILLPAHHRPQACVLQQICVSGSWAVCSAPPRSSQVKFNHMKIEYSFGRLHLLWGATGWSLMLHKSDDKIINGSRAMSYLISCIFMNGVIQLGPCAMKRQSKRETFTPPPCREESDPGD